MPRTDYLILDISTAPIADAAQFIDGTISAPSNYKDEAKIAAYIAEKQVERAEKAALDMDLSRITGVGMYGASAMSDVTVMLCKDEDAERTALRILATVITGRTSLVSYNGRSYDWPLLMRRARYLGVSFPSIDTDKYRSSHFDLLEILSQHDKEKRRPLSFYVKRLGWTDLVKPLDGAEEARVHETGKWQELHDSLIHDVTACRRLAEWLGLMEPLAVNTPTEVFSEPVF